jgi:hypothetical protein
MIHLQLPKSPGGAVISTEAADSFIVRRAVERPPHFTFATAFAFASKIGPGFSPDIPRAIAETGFSPRDMPSVALASRYPKASALGLSSRQGNLGFSPRAAALASRYAKPSGLALSSQINARGFSPWGMLSWAEVSA